MDKAYKKARLKAWRQDARTKAHEGLPLADADMEALFDMLDNRLQEGSCDHTRRLTEEWLRSLNHPVTDVTRWLDANGGFCDCEILANAEEAWREATGRD